MTKKHLTATIDDLLYTEITKQALELETEGYTRSSFVEEILRLGLDCFSLRGTGKQQEFYEGLKDINNIVNRLVKLRPYIHEDKVVTQPVTHKPSKNRVEDI